MTPQPIDKATADSIENAIDQAIDGRIVGHVVRCTCDLKGDCAGCRHATIMKAH